MAESLVWQPAINMWQINSLCLYVCLVQTELDMVSGQPTDRLSSVARDWCLGIGSAATTLTEARQDVLVTNEIDKMIQLVNDRAPSSAELIHKWRILPTDFTIAGGELGMFRSKVR